MELTRYPFVKSALRSRWPQLVIFTIFLAGFAIAILSGFFGTPVGSRNFGIVFVWIAWWAILILVAVPFLGRGWCAVCPIPVVGDWFQRGAILSPHGGSKGFGLNRRWPKRLNNIWIQNIAFTLVALFSSLILTTPLASAAVLAGMLFLAFGLSMVFERRAFCRYVCPVGGFIGLYSQTAPVELRVTDKAVCASCKDKPCYNGSATGYGCPWGVSPTGLAKNSSCGLCMECLRTCPNDNIAIRTRPFGADIYKPTGRRLDESYKAFIMLGAALIYAGVLLGPWGELKLAAYQIGSSAWFGYAASFLIFVLALMPVLFLLAVQTGRLIARSDTSLRKDFISYSYSLVPLGLMAWVAFSLSFVLTNASYILISLSDPFGWGWNLFGTAALAWTPVLSASIPVLQIGVLLTGLVWSVYTALRISTHPLSRQPFTLQVLPIAGFNLLVTVGLMILLL